MLISSYVYFTMFHGSTPGWVWFPVTFSWHVFNDATQQLIICNKIAYKLRNISSYFFVISSRISLLQEFQIQLLNIFVKGAALNKDPNDYSRKRDGEINKQKLLESDDETSDESVS